MWNTGPSLTKNSSNDKEILSKFFKIKRKNQITIKQIKTLEFKNKHFVKYINKYNKNIGNI